MTIRMRLGVAAALGMLAAVGSGLRATAQVPPVNPFGADGPYNPFNFGGNAGQQVQMPAQGTWAEVINVTSRWLIVQNQLGQQFPIASDRVRQFLIRWPYSLERISPGALIELSGPDAGSNTIITDHMDVYENEALALVSPTTTVLSYNNRAITPFDIDQSQSYGSNYWFTPEESAMPGRVHIVGHPLGAGDGMRISSGGQNSYGVQASGNGMSVTQVSLGSNSYARRGDVVYLVPENLSPRSVDVSQLVLYKKIPLRAFQAER